MYPPFPQEPQPRKTYGLEDVVRWYDTLASLGLTPIPKHTLDKRPALELRGLSREDKIAAFASGLSDGWFLMPSDEPDVRLLIVDMDVADIREYGNDPEAVYHRLQALSETKFVVYTPSGGVHLYYRLKDEQTAPKRVGPRKDIRGLEVRSPEIAVGVASFCGLAQYSGGKATKKGVKDGFVGSYDPAPYGEYHVLPYASDEIVNFLNNVDIDKPVDAVVNTENAANKRVVQQHNELPYDKKVARTLEALDWALRGFSGQYEDWLALWMSAWAGSDGDMAVCEYILSDDRISWSDGAKGKRTFRYYWEKHTPRDTGYTVGTLYHMAYESGWLADSSQDLKETHTVIDVQRVSEWIEGLDVVPTGVLLKSQTGSGKTYGIKSLYEKMGSPKTLIIVPSIRLALDMAATLATELQLPAVAYRDDETDLIRPDEELIDAHVLITTLQTFVRRLYVQNEGVMKRYGLVYIEECDQLLSSFASGGGGELSSHVKQIEAELGFMALAEAFRDGVTVWGVDATATKVSYHTFNVLSQGNFQYVENKYVTTKPAVQFINEHMAAYTLIQNKLAEGKSVVVPCDTAHEANSVYGTMLELGVIDVAHALCITSPTSDTDKRVLEFARNANEFAPKYRFLVYNSAMASGVSVTSFRPDVVVQLSRGYLTPRVQLQLLNRYRKQAEVYCYYGSKNVTDAGYTVDELLKLAQDHALSEAKFILIPLLDRSTLAGLRDEIRAIAQSDSLQQRRNPVQFYKRLLIGDGRDVIPSTQEIIIQRVVDVYKADKERRKNEMAYLASHWRDVEAYKSGFPSGWTDTQIRQSLVHQWVRDVLNGSVPLEDDQTYVYEVCRDLYKKSSALHAFVFQDDAVRFSEKALGNKERAFMTHPNYVSRVVLAGLLRYLFRTPDEHLSPETLEARAMPFLRVVEENEDVYNRVVRRKDKSLSVLRDKYSEQDMAVRVAKTVAATIGMKMRKHKGGTWHIANLQDVLDFLRWQNFGAPVDIDISARGIEKMREERTNLLSLYSTLTDEEMNRVIGRLMSVPLETALAVSQGVNL